MAKIMNTDGFVLADFTHSYTAVRLGIDNTPTREHALNLESVYNKILIPLHTAMKKPIFITSAYRSKALNAQVPGSSSTSQHCTGQAVDFEVEGWKLRSVVEFIIEQTHLFQYDQLILEYPPTGWIHVSYRKGGGNRGQALVKRKGSKYELYKG